MCVCLLVGCLFGWIFYLMLSNDYLFERHLEVHINTGRQFLWMTTSGFIEHNVSVYM